MSQQTTFHFRPVRLEKKVTVVLIPCSHSLPFYLSVSEHTSTRPHQTLQLCLQIPEGKKKNSILHRGVEHFFFFFHILFETWQEQNIERVRWSKTSSNVYLAMLSELFTFSSPFEEGRECTVCPYT